MENLINGIIGAMYNEFLDVQRYEHKNTSEAFKTDFNYARFLELLKATEPCIFEFADSYRLKQYVLKKVKGF